MPLTVLNSGGSKISPLSVPVLDSHADQSKALRVTLELTSSHGPDDEDLYKLTFDSDGIWAAGPVKSEKIARGVRRTFLVYLTKDLVGSPDTVRFRGRKYGAKGPNGAVVNGKDEGEVTLYFAPEVPSVEVPEPVEDVANRAADIVWERIKKAFIPA